MPDNIFGLISIMTEIKEITFLRQTLEDFEKSLNEPFQDKTSILINLRKLKETIVIAQACGHNVQTLRFNSTDAFVFYCALCENQTDIDRVERIDLNQIKKRQKKRRRTDKNRCEPMEIHGGNSQHNPLEGGVEVVDIDGGSNSVNELIDVSVGDTLSDDNEPNIEVASTSSGDEHSFAINLSLRKLKEAIDAALVCDHNIQKLRNLGGLGFYCVLCERKTVIFGAF